MVVRTASKYTVGLSTLDISEINWDFSSIKTI